MESTSNQNKTGEESNTGLYARIENWHAEDEKLSRKGFPDARAHREFSKLFRGFFRNPSFTKSQLLTILVDSGIAKNRGDAEQIFPDLVNYTGRAINFELVGDEGPIKNFLSVTHHYYFEQKKDKKGIMRYTMKRRDHDL